MGLICFVVAAVLFFLLGLNIVEPSAKYNLDEIGLGFIALGLALAGVALPFNFTRKE
jgi:hypothetical protein